MGLPCKGGPLSSGRALYRRNILVVAEVFQFMTTGYFLAVYSRLVHFLINSSFQVEIFALASLISQPDDLIIVMSYLFIFVIPLV